MKVISGLLIKGFKQTESAAATWTTSEVSLPSAIREGIGVSIVKVEMGPDTPADIPAAGAQPEAVSALLLEEDKAAFPDLTDPDIIARTSLLTYGDGVNVQAVILNQYGYKNLVPYTLGYITGREKIFQGLISTNAAAASSMAGRMYMYQVKFTQAELVELGFRESFE